MSILSAVFLYRNLEHHSKISDDHAEARLQLRQRPRLETVPNTPAWQRHILRYQKASALLLE